MQEPEAGDQSQNSVPPDKPDRTFELAAGRASLVSQDWHHLQCYGCGPDNPVGLHASFPFDEATGEVRFEYTVPAPFVGAPGYVHGGVLAALMDEAQGVLCFHVGHPVMTEKLQTSYHKATELGQPFLVRAWLTAVRKRRLYTRATIHGTDGVLRVSSRASWYSFPERLMRRMFHDGDEERFQKVIAFLEPNRRRARKIRQRLRGKNASNT